MTADGGFMLSRQTLGSWGTPGHARLRQLRRASPRTSTAPTPSCPAASSGSRFADGKVEDRTIGIYRDAETGSADPAEDGLWLDDDPFWKDDED